VSGCGWGSRYWKEMAVGLVPGAAERDIAVGSGATPDFQQAAGNVRDGEAGLVGGVG